MAVQANESLQLSSPAFVDGAAFPIQFTCEGKGISPPFNWKGTPDGTQSLVVIMDHMPKQRLNSKVSHGEKDNKHPRSNPKQDELDKVSTLRAKRQKPESLRWYWTLYNIPADTSGIASGESVGTLGSNVVNHKNEYTPPCSKGPRQKNYTFHLYALSEPLALSQSENISEAILRESMRGLILDSDSLTVSFERSCQSPPHLKQLNQPNQLNKLNQLNQSNQLNQLNKPNKPNQLEQSIPLNQQEESKAAPSTLPLCKKPSTVKSL